MDRVSETQLQVGENSDWIIWQVKGYSQYIYSIDDEQLLILHRAHENQSAHCVFQAVVNTSSDLLSDLYHDAWTDLPQSEQAEAATNVLDAVEDSAFCVAEKYNEPKTVTTITINIGELDYLLPTLFSLGPCNIHVEIFRFKPTKYRYHWVRVDPNPYAQHKN